MTRALELTAGAPLIFTCRNCQLEFAEPYCDFCGADLMPVKDAPAAHTAASTTGAQPKGA